MHRRLLIILFLAFFACCLHAQYATRILSPELRSLRVQYLQVETGEPQPGDPVRPFLVLHDGRVGEEGDALGHLLEFSFDEMSHDSHHYSYTVRHLNRAYQDDDLISTEYLSGFTSADITDHEQSLNTARIYTHYRFVFPNEDMTLTASGNYLLSVYEDNRSDRPVAMVTFCVVEPEVEVSARLRANTDIELNGRYQQLDIDLSGLTGSTIAQDYTLVVRQNGRTDNEVVAPAPTYVENSRLRWTQCRSLIFEGGSPYRHLDIFSTYIAGNGVDRIVYDRNDYHALLFPDEGRGPGCFYAGDYVLDKCGAPYMHEYDAHGQFVINAERTDYDDTEAEYMWVHFLLRSPFRPGVSVYVAGDWNQNRYDYRNRMEFDAQLGGYCLTTLLKQGGYDYQYLTLGEKPQGAPGFMPSSTAATPLVFEGSHWQTVNEYTIYVYYRPFGATYDRLVALTVL